MSIAEIWEIFFNYTAMPASLSLSSTPNQCTVFTYCVYILHVCAKESLNLDSKILTILVGFVLKC